MTGVLKLEIVTPDEAFPVMDIAFLAVPAEQGQLTILANHEDMVCGLKAGSVISRDVEGTQTEWEIGPGTLSVARNNITVLVRDIKNTKQQ